MLDHFSFIAPWYDRAIPFTRRDLLLELLELPCAGALLDVAGGTGRVTGALAPYLSHVVTADESRGMLVQAQVKGLQGLECLAETLPIPADAFERLLMVDALHHVSDQRAVLAEMWRILRPGGILLIEEPDILTWQVKILALVEKALLMRSHFLSPEQIAAMLPARAQVEIIRDGFNAWVRVRKPAQSV